MISIPDERTLDELLTEPRAVLSDFVGTLDGPLVVLGASGKMGPTLAVLAKRAAAAQGRDLEVIGVARFSDRTSRQWLDDRGVRTIQCDLLDRTQVDSLPNAENVIYMAGRKFGTSDDPSMTWSMNTIAPANALERYSSSRVVALSTGTVYPLVDVASGGSRESDGPDPVGEYANACLGRERLFEYYARHHGTRVCIVRLNFAVEMRYGVIVDIARKIISGEPVDASMAFFNCIWQRDANEMCIRALDLCTSPATVMNLTGTETLRVRDVAGRLATLMGREAHFVGSESNRAYLNDASAAVARLGAPEVSIGDVIQWTAHWIARGGSTLGKPTHFEVSDGRY